MRDQILTKNEVVLIKLYGLIEKVAMESFLSSSAKKGGGHRFLEKHRIVFSGVTDITPLRIC